MCHFQLLLHFNIDEEIEPNLLGMHRIHNHNTRSSNEISVHRSYLCMTLNKCTLISVHTPIYISVHALNKCTYLK